MISIIVPIYNVEKYLSRCIESLINQTHRDVEIILVDDGSADGCGRICDEYAARDNRIKVIHQQNAGVSAARNAGLRAAKGDYTGFCDADDFVHPEMFEKLISAMIESGADLAICGYNYVDENGCISRQYVELPIGEANQEDCCRLFFDIPPSIRLSVWNKLFKSSLLNELFFSEGIKGAEDAEFLGKYIDKIHSAIIINEPLYLNCERMGSATRGGLGADAVEPALDIYQATRKQMRKRYPRIDPHAQRYYLDACLLNYGLQKENDSFLKKKILDRIRNEIPSLLINKEIFWKTRIVYILFALGLRE